MPTSESAPATEPLVAFVACYRGPKKAFETMPFSVTQGMDLKSKAIPLELTIPLAGPDFSKADNIRRNG